MNTCKNWKTYKITRWDLFMSPIGKLEWKMEQFDGNVGEGKIQKYSWKSLIYERQRTLCQTLESSQWHQWPFRKLIERKHLRKWDCSINLQYWNHIQNYPHLWKKRTQAISSTHVRVFIFLLVNFWDLAWNFATSWLSLAPKVDNFWGQIQPAGRRC